MPSRCRLTLWVTAFVLAASGFDVAQAAQPPANRSERAASAKSKGAPLAAAGKVPAVTVAAAPAPLASVMAQSPLPGFVERAVIATPASKPADVAADLLLRPPGRRVLLLSNFVDDISKYDSISLSGPRSSRLVASPWIDRGVEVVRRRVTSFAAALSTFGVRPDVVVLRSTIDLGANRYSSAWQAISADPRSAALRPAIGVRAFSSAAMSQAVSRDRWNQLAVIRLANYLNAAVAAPIRHVFPGVAMAHQDRSALAGASLTARSSRFGSHDLVAIRIVGEQTEAVSQAVAAFRANVLAAGRPVIAWIDAQLPVPASVPDASLLVAAEVACHAILAGASGALISEAVSPGKQLLVSSEFRGFGAGGDRIVPSVGASIVASGATVMATAATWLPQSTLVRVSISPGVTQVRLIDSLGRDFAIAVPASARGAWLAVPNQVALLSASEIVPEPVAPSRQWHVIRDDFPGDLQPNPSIGGEQYMLVGQYDCDASIATSGVIDPNRVIAQVERLIAAGRGSSWGVLDFEEPFDALWEAGDADARYRPAVESMIATIRALKVRFPAIKWTYYGIPRVKYWFPDGEWALVSPETRIARYEHATAPVADLLPELDFVMPAVYDVYERAMGMPTTRTPRVEAEAWWRRANVEAVHHFFASRGLSRPPVVPMVSPWFQGGGFATVMRPIPAEEFLEEQLKPLVDAGVDGIGVWGGMRYALYVSRWPGDHPNPQFLRLREDVRATLARDYLGGAVRAPSIDWIDTEVQQSLAGQLDATMMDAITACLGAGR
jgi:hypothetical protein